MDERAAENAQVQELIAESLLDEDTARTLLAKHNYDKAAALCELQQLVAQLRASKTSLTSEEAQRLLSGSDLNVQDALNMCTHMCTHEPLHFRRTSINNRAARWAAAFIAKCQQFGRVLS
jgi:hypothetical protein